MVYLNVSQVAKRFNVEKKVDIKDDMDDVCIDEVMEEEWFVRDNIEIDEKLPQLAQEVIRRNINYTDDGEASTEQMIEVLHDELDSFTDMTVEEIEYTILKLETACILTSINSYRTRNSKSLKRDGE
jgi:hypothetical protein